MRVVLPGAEQLPRFLPFSCPQGLDESSPGYFYCERACVVGPYPSRRAVWLALLRSLFTARYY